MKVFRDLGFPTKNDKSQEANVKKKSKFSTAQ